MPEILIHLVSGRTPKQKKMLMRSVTDAVVTHLDVAPEKVVVQIVESSPDSKARGGIPFSDQ